MPDTIGRFEILSEIARGESARVYKASDPESGQTVALKVLAGNFSPEETATLVQRVLEEAETSKILSSPNIAILYGAGEIDGKFCAATEYVQGKSIASMLSQNDTFSIWDLLDVARQACQGLDHAQACKVVHCTLEPAKVLVTWDGTVKILGFGISSMGALSARASGSVPETLRYMSPEQVSGEALDGRSNLFTLGAILYEMVTDRKAFGGDNAEQVRQEIMVGMPVAPLQINSKMQPGLSAAIMKALSKSPGQRYQSGQELVADLESCKESSQKAAARKMPQAARSVEPARVAEEQPVAAKVSAAAAGVTPGAASSRFEQATPAAATMSAEVSSLAAVAERATISIPQAPISPASVSPAPISPAPVSPAPKPAGGNGSKRPSFSEMDSLPPLKEIHIAPAPAPEPEAYAEAPPAAEMHDRIFRGAVEPEKIKTPPAEIARKAVAELKKTPPQLFLYSIGGAVCVILLVLGVMFSRIHSENADENAAPSHPATSAPAQPSITPEPAPATIEASPVPMTANAPVAGPDVISVQPKRIRPRVAKVVPPPAPVIVPGQLSVSSTPEGAQVLVDGHRNPAWLTPFDLAGLAPGQHLVSVSKPGYATENRTLDVGSGSKSFLVVQLAPLGATALISSVPGGAEVFMDGRDLGRATPAQIPVDKLGAHIFTLRKEGYLEESTNTTLQAGQSFQYGPVLRALGVTEDIKVGGKFKKLFGGDTAGMGSVSVRTQPKGAQVSVNHHVLDKGSPVEFSLNPGNYILDITLSGYKSVERIITVDHSGKVAVDETLERQ